ncbi:hypothetical protein EDB80DRAFT_887955 [Ilyonectria destructans]|nr:hypothetical protein EDB80DRAFT_887955 [Ilyonectria destructans]
MLQQTWVKTKLDLFTLQSTAIAAVLLPFLYVSIRTCVQDYHGWLNLGEGGLPYNVGGWVIQWILKLTMAKRNTIDIKCYARPLPADLAVVEKRRNTVKHLGPLPQRLGSRPKVAHWVIPHRQLREKPPSRSLIQACRHAFQSLANERQHVATICTSVLERHGSGLFVLDPTKAPAVAVRSRGEITHFHESDWSAHATLSYPDGEEVIQKGWGERHALSGSLLPLGYTLLYAPESEADVQVIQSIMAAAVEFMTGETGTLDRFEE